MSTTTSNISVEPCTPSDLSRCCTIMTDAFQDNAPFLSAYFPNLASEEGKKQGTARLQKWQASDPRSHFLKAVERSSSGGTTAIGFAVWTHMLEAPLPDLAATEDVEATWGKGDDARFIQDLWADYVVPRGEESGVSRIASIVSFRNGCRTADFLRPVLELLAVDPEYGRRGAGTKLVRWGTDKADEMGLEAVVEGTPVGKPVYERSGFRTVIEEMKFEKAEKHFPNKRMPVLVFMTRTPT
ncbi:hypothetical protein C8R43DRAFT_883148 [Mycena crocata]|nr:hypothetical protein C8R43DRAFT_883148 [Mycena crocata]